MNEIVKEEISFTKLVKEEVSLIEGRTDDEYKALLAGFIKLNSNLVIRNNSWLISIKSENVKVAKLIFREIKRLYPVDARIIISEKKKLRVNKDNKIVHIEISKNVKEILKDLNIYSDEVGFDYLPAISMFKDKDVLRSYIAGSFLASGSVNSPITKNYHLEIATNNAEHAEYLIKVLKKFNLLTKSIQRRNQHVVYMKRSESISDFLNLIGAWQSLLKFEDIRIQRDQYNSVNRLFNCEISNEKKAMENGSQQKELIEWYDKSMGIKSLKESLRIVAEARLNNPEATYMELTEYIENEYHVSLSKPGLSYRMKKLLEKIETLKEK